MITQYNPSLSQRMMKLSALSVFGIFATFSIFVVMSKLATTTGSHAITKTEPFQVSIAEVKDDSDANKIKKTLPKPPVKPMPPERVPKTEISEDTNILGSLLTPVVSAPSLNLNPSLNFGVQNNSARPMFQIQPKYPVKAARDGIEGWVSLSFSIDVLGNVYDINVIDAEPKRMFEQAARKALKRWRYQPKLVEGNAVEQHGQSVMLEFKLGDS